MTTDFLVAQLSNLLFASGLAAFIFLITKVWKNPNLAHALWLLVLLKLLTPPLVTVPLPGFLLLDSEQQIAEQYTDTALTLPYEEKISSGEMDPIFSSRGITPDFSTKSLFVLDTDSRSKIGIEFASILSWPQWLLLGWGLGLCAFVFVSVRRHLSLLRVIAESRQLDTALKEDAQRIARQMGVAICPQLRITSAYVSPLVLGSWRKQIILLPSQLLSELNRNQIRSVLAHELAHIRRRDHLVRFFEVFVLALHWWNPLAWLASWKLQQAEEECCDAWVTWALPEARRTYGQTLLQTVEFLTEKRLLPLATGTSFGKCFLERRIDMILNQTVNRKMSRAASFAILLFGALVLPIAFAQELSTEPSPPKVGKNLATEALADTDNFKDLTAWAQQHGGSFNGGQLTLDIYDSNSPTHGKSNIKDADLEFLSQMDTDSVKSLYLRGHAISDKGLKHIAQLTELRILSVFSNNISSDGLKHLVPLRHLTSLTILSNRIDDTGMKHLAEMNLNALRKFNMPSQEITSAGLKDFCAGNLSNLRSLGLSRTRIDSSGLEYLNQLPALEELYLNVTDIDDRGLAHIATLSKLRKLSLRKTKITDRGLKSLRNLPRLSSLNLESTAVSDIGILHFAKRFKRLQIALADTDVTRAGFENLQALNPNIDILFSPAPIIEAGNTPRKKVVAVLESVRLQTYPEPKGSLPMQEVIVTIRNRGETPIRMVFADLTTRTNDGATTKRQNCLIYAAWDKESGILPGLSKTTPDGAGHPIPAYNGERLIDVTITEVSDSGSAGKFSNRTGRPLKADDLTPGVAQFPVIVPFEQGAVRFKDGDNIMIQEIRGTSEAFTPGNTYQIKGTYTLASHDQAQLAAYTTAKDIANGTSKTLRVQTTVVDQGKGKFTLLLPMLCEGWPHVSFYPRGGGEGFGGNYFGTGKSVLKQWWGTKHTDR